MRACVCRNCGVALVVDAVDVVVAAIVDAAAVDYLIEMRVRSVKKLYTFGR